MSSVLFSVPLTCWSYHCFWAFPFHTAGIVFHHTVVCLFSLWPFHWFANASSFHVITLVNSWDYFLSTWVLCMKVVSISLTWSIFLAVSSGFSSTWRLLCFELMFEMAKDVKLLTAVCKVSFVDDTISLSNVSYNSIEEEVTTAG